MLTFAARVLDLLYIIWDEKDALNSKINKNQENNNKNHKINEKS